MKNLKKIPFIALFLCFAAFKAKAQELYFSNVPGIGSRAYYNKVIGENENGIYLLRFKDPEIRRLFVVEQYNHNLDFYAEQAYKIGRREKLVKAFTTDTSLMFVVYNQKLSKRGIDLYTLRKNIKEIGNPVNLLKSDKIESGTDAVTVEYDVQRRNFAVFTEEVDNANRQVINIYLFACSGRQIYKKQIELPENHRDVRIVQTAAGEYGEAACLLEIESAGEFSFLEKEKKKYMLLSCDSASDISGKLIQDKNIYINSPDIMYDIKLKEFVMSAFYSYKSSNGNQGMSTLRFTPFSLPISQIINRPFSRDLVKQVLGAKPEADGKEISDYFIRRLIPKTNGGYLVVAENFHKSSKFETIFVNGTSPQVTQSDIYNFDDVLLFNFDSTGEMIWYKQIHKKQSSVASISYYHSIGIFVTDYKVNIIYNDDNQSDNRIMYVSIDNMGKETLKMLLRSNSAFTAVVPVEGKQVGYNRLVIPLLQDRNMSLLKIVEPEVAK